MHNLKLLSDGLNRMQNLLWIQMYIFMYFLHFPRLEEKIYMYKQNNVAIVVAPEGLKYVKQGSL